MYCENLVHIDMYRVKTSRYRYVLQKTIVVSSKIHVNTVKIELNSWPPLHKYVELILEAMKSDAFRF